MKEIPQNQSPQVTEPKFSRFISLPTREQMALLKGSLFTALELSEAREQPHGIDLIVSHFHENSQVEGH